MAITETQKSRTIRARDKNPPAPSKPRAKPGPKPKDRPRTAARFERDEPSSVTRTSRTKEIHRPDLDVALPLVGQLGKFRSALAQEMEEGKVQTTITSFFK
ncbi:hypothetical protein B0H14DRAFT_2580573 [Mycena olivaceomarginata]|nr:hypothetical protein B0H14DRAFT_2580573 [Mycena olivaceomarginata]